MNVQSIGESAGIIWNLLHGVHRKWDFQEVNKATGLSDRHINAAVGFLAREGKITIEESKVGRKKVIYLELNYIIG